MDFNHHVKIITTDSEGNKQQVYPETDVDSIIGLGDQNGDLIDRIAKLEDRVKQLENRVLYH